MTGREIALPNRMSLSSGLLWLTLNLDLIILFLSQNNIFFLLCVSRETFSCACTCTRLKTTFLDKLLTDGSEVVTVMRRPPFTPQEDTCYSCLLEAGSNARPQFSWKD
jgi:hypothetical protein